MGDTLDFTDVFAIVRGALSAGRLKLNKTGIVFKSAKTGRIDSIPIADIKSTKWMRVARGFGLKISLNNGQHYKYDGFKEPEYQKLKEFYKKHYEVELQEQELCVKGWNWGMPNFDGTMMSFEVDNKPAFEIPLKDISQATIGKNEVTVEFHRSDDASISLMEMRFFVPADTEGNVDTAKEFHEALTAKADLIQATGDAIVTFEEVACLTPRGRYSIRVYPTFLQLHGKTYDYKIPHTTVLRLFLLPHQDNRFMFFVISMDPPIRQGQTRYPFLILQFERDEEMTCKLNLSEEEIEQKYSGKITQDISGPIFEVVSKVLNTICQRKITVPAQHFKSGSNSCSITCSYKASNGLLYPLERGFIFVHKPAVHIRFEEIANVNFARGSTTGRTFDFEVELKHQGSAGSSTVLTFSSLPREEYSQLYEFVNKKQLRIKNKGGKDNGKGGHLDAMMESDDEHDAYLQKVKAEGRERYEDDDDDDTDSDDEDFVPNAQDDVKEEYESDVTSSSGSDSEEEEEQEKKKKKDKKKRKSSTEGGASKPKKAKGEGTKRAKKDKNAPKRGMSAYMLFFNENRPKILTENPGIAFVDVSKKASEMWKAQTDKTKWDALAKKDKERYEAEMKIYKEKVASGEIIPTNTASSTKKTKEKSKSSKKSPSSSRNIKDMINKKDSSGAGEKYKSKEFIDSSDDSSDDDKAEKKKSKSSSSKKDEPTKKEDKAKSESESDASDSDAAAGGDAEEKSSPVADASHSTRSRRAGGGDEELVALNEDGSGEEEEEAQYSGEQSSDDDSD